MISKNLSWWPIAIIIKPLIASFEMSEKLFNTDEIVNPILNLCEIVSRLLKQLVPLIHMTVGFTALKQLWSQKAKREWHGKHFSLYDRGDNFRHNVGVACHFLGLS